MDPGLRSSMSWLHTWAGLVCGSVLVAVFWMGSLAVFDCEIDRWMMPDTRLPPPAAPSLDAVAAPAIAALPAGTAACYLSLPDDRNPTMRLGRRVDGEWMVQHIDPRDGAILPDPGTLGGSRFLYPFHYSLHIRAAGIGYWVVGVAAMAMLALLISGIVIHGRVLADFFAFRRDASGQRVRLDLHALCGLSFLPFHAVITVSGLIIFFAIYFPSVRDVAYAGDRAAFAAEAYGATSRPRAGILAKPASLDAIVAEATRLWDGGRAGLLWITNPGDAHAAILVRRFGEDRVAAGGDPILFDGAAGTVIGRHREGPILGVQRFLTGLHMIRFRHWAIRWLYFAGGLVGCVLISSGFLLWLGARRRHASGAGLRIVDAVAVASTVGLVAATLAFLVANRLLPPGSSGRAQLEVAVFGAVWLASAVHASYAGRSAWRIQTLTVAILAAVAPPLNWLGTGAHPLRAGPAVIGVDLALLTASAVALAALRRMSVRGSGGSPA